ncbi:unnamed protein product [Adineta steineri]|uniref:Uncharacterized protein n=1 Tax=Adineta steineri TaxID=433720 RepID=A0A815YHU4_9BILA|nr:unnamed protein product [Adineta steineri]CAF1570256.1 unnamed protein product [Adineta steineri]
MFSIVLFIYLYSKKSSSIYTITVLLGLQGGLSIVLKWMCPKIVRIASKVNDYRKKRMNTIYPVNSLEITPNVTLSTTIHNPACNLESRSTPITSRTIATTSIQCSWKVLFRCLLLMSIIAVLTIFSFYVAREVPSTSTTNDTTNSNSTINTTTSTLTSTTVPCSKLNFQLTSINISDVPLYVRSFAVADFNNDSRPDIVVFCNYDESVIILRGNENVTFTAEKIFPKKRFGYVNIMKVGDFNNDNRADLVFTYGGLDYVNILFGNGNGTFKVLDKKLETRECIPDDIIVADFNHDNNSDIAVINTESSNVCMFLGNANDTLSSYLIFSTGQYSKPESVTVSDFNSDGHVDIAVANSRALNVGIFLGCGNGTFEIQKRSFTFMGFYPNHIVSGDFDGDTQQDVVIAQDFTRLVAVLSKYRNGFFTVKEKFIIKSDNIKRMVVGDFNCDDHLDIAVMGVSYGTDMLVGYGDDSYCLGTNRTYLIKKDLMSDMIKTGEFTVYDNQGKITLFRMESKFAVLHNIRIFKGLNKKQNPIALLKAKLSFVLYKGTIAIFNKNSNEWINGTIEQNFKIVGNKFTIKYNNTEISMEGKTASLDTTFIDQSNKQVLAKFHKRVSSLFWRNKYDLQVLSDKLPDQVYFLGIAARDINNNRIQTG